MTIRVYKSTDASAPTLQGIVGGAYSSGWADGSLLELLRKILVTGYGTKTAAGWSLAFSGTSEGVFKQGAGCGFYLHVLDDGSATAGAREASFNGGESYTAVSTGTGLFPSSGQNGGKLYFRKSDTADTTQRQWVCYADNKTVYLFASPTGAYYSGMLFGDFVSFFSGDAYNCIAVGRTISAAADNTTNEHYDDLSVNVNTSLTGHYTARTYSQGGSSINSTKMNNTLTYLGSSPGKWGSGGNMPFPNPADSKFWLGRIYVGDASGSSPTNVLRGYLRGLWASQHVSSNTPMEYSFAGTDGLVGRTFRILGLPGGTTATRTVVETSDTWD